MPLSPVGWSLRLVDVPVIGDRCGVAVEGDRDALVAAPSGDKPEVARRMAGPSAEICLRAGSAKQACVAWAVGEVTSHPSLRPRARELRPAPTPARYGAAAGLLDPLLTR